jgi:hypothetical protein
MLGGRWIVHLLELAIDHFIRRLAEARPESLSMLVEAAEIVLDFGVTSRRSTG